MSVINKAEVEEEIINRYLNKDINLLEKEMALNVLLACDNPDKLSKDDLFFLHNMVINMSSKEFTDNLIAFGRENFNSDKLDQKEMEEMALLALKQREDYGLQNMSKLPRKCSRCGEKLNKDNRDYEYEDSCDYCAHVMHKVMNEEQVNHENTLTNQPFQL